MRTAACILLFLSLLGTQSVCGADPEPLNFDSLDLDDDLPIEETPEEAGMEKGDKKQFHVTTDDKIGTLETGDVYASNQSLFKVTAIKSKGDDGGRFTVERIGGTNDPGRNWTRRRGVGPASIISRETLWDLYLEGGMLMHVILACGVITIILGLNSAWVFRIGRQCSSKFIEPALNCLRRNDFPGFQEMAQKETGLFGHICRAMTVRFDTSNMEDINSRCGLEAGRQIRRLKMPLQGLSLIAAVAPLLGLLGTVIGMVVAFEAVAFDAASVSKTQSLASGIRIALFTTMAGLCVAIPAMFIRFFSNARLSAVVSECELHTEHFLHEIALLKRNGGAAAEEAEPDKQPEPATA